MDYSERVGVDIVYYYSLLIFRDSNPCLVFISHLIFGLATNVVHRLARRFPWNDKSRRQHLHKEKHGTGTVNSREETENSLGDE